MSGTHAFPWSRRTEPADLPAHPVCRVLICDERSATRTAMNKAVTAIRSVREIDGVSDGFALADAFFQNPADLVLIGHVPGRNGGLQATELLLGLFPAAPVIAFGPSAASVQLVMAVSRGARGLMLWDRGKVHQAPSGPDVWTQRCRPGDHRDNGDDVAVLPTERELQVLAGMSQGRSNAEIGRELLLSEDTVKTHARRLFQKLGARDRAHAVALGMRNSLLA